ncbi:Fe-S cluster assembly sulfur transfer protein SufU [Ornithinicoccus halotolerans]|uniref:Fe-S cluster assembly sulfur transfer protein SufU n=1 Tax=Ornithinicoccus halotolerans TaxID=1748220 RepID=UPI001296B0A8|nr:SUF system NifU family Fe-S cluster assembly protein [Ornithinicoccus halotolerans]
MDLYAELIIEHAKRPQHAGLREPFDTETHHLNPSCGDEVTLRVRLDRSGEHPVLADVSYDAMGCSISVAATSVLAEECLGRPVPETLQTYAAMHAMLTSRGQDEGDPEQIGDGVAFAGVSRYPMRVKCALLGWAAYLDALARAGVDIGGAPTDVRALERS